MTFLGLDLNAGRARAVAGPPGDFPYTVPLEPPHAELPVAVSLEGRPAVGAAGLRVCRRSPHLARVGFLPEIGKPAIGPRHGHPDAADALALVLKHLYPICKGSEGLVLAVPAYLTTPQIGLLFALADEAGLPLLGCVAAPLALGLAAHAEREWTGNALVIDADDYALTVSKVGTAGGQAQLLESQSLARLGLRAWRERLLNGVAERCIRQSRRDPRDSPQAEQSLFDQLDVLLEACRQGRPAQVGLQTVQWYQNVALRPEDTVALCAPLAREALAFIIGACRGELPGAVVLSAAAARLPGLTVALHAQCADWSATPGRLRSAPDLEDFGEGLLEEAADEGTPLLVLPPDAVGRAAHGLAAHFHSDDLPPGHLDTAAPLPLPQPAEAGPPRLSYQGEEYLLDRPAFALGRQPACDLAFDGDAYPMVAPRHCEIHDTEVGHLVRDRSGGCTFVNDSPLQGPMALQPGDALRLGAGGPVLRFLGQPAERGALTGTA